MSQPIVVDLPHSLGIEEAKRRMQNGIGSFGSHIPGGAAEVRHGWTGDTMDLHVAAMGQTVDARIDVHERFVRFEVVLPPFLSFFADKIAGALRKRGGELLEDKSKG